MLSLQCFHLLTFRLLLSKSSSTKVTQIIKCESSIPGWVIFLLKFFRHRHSMFLDERNQALFRHSPMS